jgi:cyclic pyranopterin phosphate synthase
MAGSLPIFGAPLQDGLERRISYLRVSITDRCNFRCTYCMPEEGVTNQARSELLDFDEIERLTRIFVGLGVRRLRLTGGEPTVRKGIVELVGRLAALQGLDEVVMTSNARLLGIFAKPLARAGLRGVNISLDSINPRRFAELTGRDELSRVLEGIEATLAAGIPIKLNCVALADTQASEIVEICRYSWERGITPRFIEHMPLSGGETYRRRGHLDAAQIRDAVCEAFGPISERGEDGRRGPARYWSCAHGDFGVISAMSEHFCGTCNRVRVTSMGELHACLGYDDGTDLRAMLRGGLADSEIADAIRAALQNKRPGHSFHISGDGGPTKHMISIGG